MSRPTYRPAVASRNLAVAYGSLVVVASVPGFGWKLWTAVFGLATLGTGLSRSSRLWVSIAFGWFALAGTIAALGNAPIEVVLLIVLLAVLAWDAGQRAIDVGAQLGREASTSQIERLHAASSAAVGAITTTVGYTAYSLVAGGQSFASVAVLLVVVTGITLLATR